MEYELHPMDSRTLKSLNVDLENPRFRKEYMRAQELWRKSRRIGGLSDTLLFLMALKYQKTEEVDEPAKAEVQPAPAKRGRPKKLATQNS